MKSSTRKLTLAMTASLLLLSANAAQARRVSVDDDRAQRPDAEFQTITEAVAAAAADNTIDTINVYPGTYNESVPVNRTLLIRAISVNDNMREHINRASNPRRDAIVVPPGDGRPGFLVTGDNVTIRGFVIEGKRNNRGRPANNSPGIYLSPNNSGYVIDNNLFRFNHYGLDLNSSETGNPTSITRNAFVSNNAFTDRNFPGGDGIYFDPNSTQPDVAASDVLNNTVIERNLFVDNQDNGIVLIGDLGRPDSQGVVSNVRIQNNDLVNNDDGILLERVAGVEVLRNDLTRNEDGIVLFRANSNLIARNDVKRSVTGDGIALFRSDNNDLEGNSSVNNDLSGIFVNRRSQGNRIVGNFLRRNDRFDAEDKSRGDGTAGTANEWRRNDCETANPEELCEHRHNKKNAKDRHDRKNRDRDNDDGDEGRGTAGKYNR